MKIISLKWTIPFFNHTGGGQTFFRLNIFYEKESITPLGKLKQKGDALLEIPPFSD